MTDIIPHNPLEGPRPELSIPLHDGSDEQVSIIVVHKDRPDYLSVCLQTISFCSFNNSIELILVDNASEGQETKDFLEGIENDIRIIRNPKNVHFGAACNIGAKEANKLSRYLIFMHCDVAILNPGWIDLLINVSESQNAGLVGVELGNYYMQNQRVDFIQEYCMLMTRDCYKAIKGFDERVSAIGAGFVATMASQQKGFKPQVLKNSLVHHYRIFSMNINEYEREVEAALAVLPKIIREIQVEL